MNTITFITAAVMISLIAVVAYIRHRREEKKETIPAGSIKLPSGQMIPNETELLKFGIPELDGMQQRDSYYLSEYVRKRLLKCRTEEERAPWEALYDRINDVCFGQF